VPGVESSVTSAWRVRPATGADAPAIARVNVSAWRSAYRGHMPDAVLDALSESERTTRWSSWLERADHGVQVVTIGGGIIGYGWVMAARDADIPGGAGEVVALYVAPEYWRSGAGTALMGAGIELARRRAYRCLILWVLTSNERARRFYERWGFVLDGAQKTKPLSTSTHSLSEVRYRLELYSEPLDAT
jgi:ribosomal protein S18 acetylase RimI-like enzyme